MFSYLDFRSHFEADGPNRFYFSMQNNSAAEIHWQMHVLIAKTAAKTTGPTLFCRSFESCSFTALHFIQHCFFIAIFYKNKAVATCSHRLPFFQKGSFDFAIYNKFFSRLHSLMKVFSQINKFVLGKFHMKCNLIEFSYVFMIISPKYFFERSKLLNETRISLNEDVFPLDKRVKHLSEFSDFLLSKVSLLHTPCLCPQHSGYCLLRKLGTKKKSVSLVHAKRRRLTPITLNLKYRGLKIFSQGTCAHSCTQI